MDDADLVCLVLGEVDRQLRAELPDLFVKVDQIKTQPDWVPFQQPRDPLYGMRLLECKWCGNDFPTYRGGTQDCCSRPHAREYRKFLLRRESDG